MKVFPMLFRSKNLSILALVCILTILLANCAPQLGGSRTVAIAVVEADPGTEASPNPQSLYAGVKLAVDQINARGGVQIKIDLYQDGDNPTQAQIVASDISKSAAVAVIGHSSIETSDAAGEIYDRNGIPVVNAIPSTGRLTENHPYHFNITYTAESEAAYLANYLVKIDERISAGIIHTDSTRDELVQKQFRNVFVRLGGATAFREAIALPESAESEGTDVEQQIKDIVARIVEIPAVERPRFLFVAASAEIAARLAELLQEAGVSLHIEGADLLTDAALADMIGKKRASVISMSDAYGQTLAKQFRNTFTGLGGEIGAQLTIQRGADEEGQIENIVSQIIAGGNPGTLFIAADDTTAANLLISMKRKGVSFPIVGASNMSSAAFLDAIGKAPEEVTFPGYFTNGILTTRAIIFDSANRYANQFLADYQNEYKDALTGEALDPGDRVVIGYDAALTLVTAIQRSEIGGADAALDRQSLYKALLDMDDAGSSAPGIVSSIYFEPSRNVTRAARFGVYQNGEIVSANVQFEPISSPNEIKDLQEQIKRGRIMTVNGGYVYKANVVYAGVDLLGIDEIDIKTSTYRMDFYLWFRYRPNDRDIDFKPDDFVFTNAEGEMEIVPIREETNSDGTILKTYRVSGAFKNQFRFYDYPFEHQDLIVEFRNQNATTSFIQYVVDRVGMRYESDNTLLANYAGNGAFDSIFGWKPQAAQVAQDIFPTYSTLGSPQNFGRSVATNYSLINVQVDIQRDSLQYIVKSLLPLLMTLILAYITFFLPLGHEERLAVGSTALLTTAFFHLTLADALPEIGYTVAMEYLFYASYAMSALIVLLETISVRYEKRGEDAKKKAEKETFEQKREQLNMLGRVIYPSILLVTIAAGFFVYNGSIRFGPKEAEAKQLVDLAVEATKPPVLASDAEASPEAAAGQVKLTFSSWRPEDSKQIQILLDAFQKHAESQGRNIVIEHRPVVSVNYDSILDIQLSKGAEGPDLFYVRPFSVDGSVAKYLKRLNEDLGIESNYDETKIVPWTSSSGAYYAAPYVGVVQGVYYNKDLFRRYGLSVPQTWNDFMDALETIKARNPNMIPIANALNASEDSEMFMSVAANFLGGPEGRARLMQTDGSGLCYNSQRVVDTFKAIEDLKPHLPNDAATINSQNSKELFFNQEAVMLFGGSWDLQTVSGNADFAWDVFAAPSPRPPTYVIFQPDVGIGVNRDSAHPEEALMFLNWLMSQEAVDLTAENLAGFYPLNKIKTSKASGADDLKFLNLVNQYPGDIRWMFTEISNKYPRADVIIRNDLYNLIAFGLTPQEAAQHLQSGLGEWYEPAQSCK